MTFGDGLPPPPAPFRQTSPYTVEMRQGGGCMMLFGLPFFLAGVVMALGAVGVVPIERAPDTRWMSLLLGVMGGVFLMVGGVMVFGRQWLILDRNTGTLTRSRGLLVPMRIEQRHLSEFNAVVIVFDPGDSDSPQKYPVRLRAMAGKDFAMTSPAQFGESRKQAEYLSRFLRLPLADTTTDHETLVSPERATETLRERLVSDGSNLDLAPRPEQMRCAVTMSGPSATIVMPGPKSAVAGVFASYAAVVIFVIVLPALLRFFSQSRTPKVVQLFFLGAVVLIFGIPSIVGAVNFMLARSRKRTVVTASPAALVIERRTGWRTNRTEIPATDILDLDYSTFEGVLESAKRSSQSPTTLTPRTERVFSFLQKWVPSKGIIIKSRQDLITFGEGLPAGELRYLYSVLRKALAGR